MLVVCNNMDDPKFYVFFSKGDVLFFPISYSLK